MTSPKDQIQISHYLHRLLHVPDVDQDALTDTLAKPIAEFNLDDWDLVYTALLLPPGLATDKAAFLRFVRKVPP